ncbi:hypothetical protein ACFSR7_06005 [Cohnella sp. GCM10020058]|uniref:hypothetical protein n=1 Tax=Cohnella sp. GCM10020058 TaxID=3317330 RepID=UPI00362B57D4
MIGRRRQTAASSDLQRPATKESATSASAALEEQLQLKVQASRPRHPDPHRSRSRRRRLARILICSDREAPTNGRVIRFAATGNQESAMSASAALEEQL